MNPPDPIRIDIVSDVVCPWCAVAYHQLAKAAAETDIAIDVHWHPFELNPQMAEAGENLREHLAAKYGTTPEGSRKARARLREIGADLGFSFNHADDMRMWNTFRAHQLIAWAEDHNKGHEAKLALFEAYFTHRQNISDHEVLADLAGRIGLERRSALDVLEAGGKADAVRQAEHFWTSRGVQSVPAMVFERRHLVSGAQGEAKYASILKQLRQAQAA